jgi:hypothetical protein
MLAACGEGPSSSAEDVDGIVGSYVEAVGGRERLESLRVVHTVDSLEIAGLRGRSESWWSRSPFRGRSVVEVGPVRQEVLVLGDSVWSVDHNGQLSQGDPQARTEADLARMTVFYDAFLEPEGITLLGDTTLDGSAAVGLSMDGPNGLKIYLSRETWLPVLLSVDVMGMQIRQFPGGYQEIEGVVVATSTVDSIPALGQASRSWNVLTEFDVPVPDTVFNPMTASVDWELLSPGEPHPFELVGQHIYMQGTVCDRPVTVLLDSGAGATVIDSALAAELGLEGVGEFVAGGVGGAQTFSFVQVPRYGLASARVTGQNLAVMPLSEAFYPSTGKHIRMVVGYDFLSRFVTRIDYGARQITLYDPQGFTYEGEGTSVPASREMSVLSLNAVIEDSLQVRLLLDTGAGGNLHLTERFLGEHPRFMEGRPSFQTEFQGVGGEETATVFRIDSLTLGGFTVPGGLCSSFQGPPMLEAYDGILGTGVLARFVVCLDYAGERVILEPSSLFEEGLHEDMTGLSLRICEGMLIVDGVIEGSAAEEAGVLPGDTLVSIEGLPVDGASFTELKDLLPEKEGETFTVGVRRDDGELRLEITTRRHL